MYVRNRKRSAVLLLLVLLSVLLPAAAGARSAGADEVWVRDHYSLFSETEASSLNAQCQDFLEKNGLPIFILTVDNSVVGGSSDSATVAYIEDYADRYIDGDCVGMIINMETRYMYLDVKCDTEETQGRLTDARQQRIREAVLDAFSSGNWYGGAQAFIRQTDTEYNRTSGSAESGSSVLYYGLCAVLAAVITGVVYAARASRHREKKIAMSADPYVAGGGIRLTRQADDFMRAYTTRVAKPKESSSGTSTHSSSGGHTHSGGGSHF